MLDPVGRPLNPKTKRAESFKPLADPAELSEGPEHTAVAKLQELGLHVSRLRCKTWIVRYQDSLGADSSLMNAVAWCLKDCPRVVYMGERKELRKRAVTLLNPHSVGFLTTLRRGWGASASVGQGS